MPINGTTSTIIKSLAYLLPFFIAGLLAWGSIRGDIAVLASKIDDLGRRITRVERILDGR